ncbi:hypothetical protein Milano_072 [Agrobacterium phage Milano]|nr:hypothetical protein Milano_072 [Agrobacterium phage Milano]
MKAQEIFEADPELHRVATLEFMKIQDEVGMDHDRVEQAKAAFLGEIEKFRTVENAAKVAREAVGL